MDRILNKILWLTYHSLGHHVPETETDLRYSEDPWLFLLGLVLSTRSRDSVVNAWISRHYGEVKLDRISKLSVQDLEIKLKTFGLTSKAHTVFNLAQMIKREGIQKFDWTKIRDVKGIGPKIWKVFSNVYLKEHCIAVDTHTRRVFNLLTSKSWDSLKIDKFLENHVDNIFYKKWIHIVLVRWGKNGYWCSADCHLCESIKLLLFKKE